jgi:hypothetical protein
VSYDTQVPFEDFLPNLTQYVPDVPELIAVNALRNAAIEFCERTLVWQFDMDAMLAIKGVNTYEIDVASGVKFVDVMFGYYKNRLIIPKSADELTRLYRWTDWRTLPGEPAYLTRVSAKEVIVVPTPDQAGNKITVRAAFAPTRQATGVGVDVFENYVEIVCNGARARLYNTPGQPYYDKSSAMEFERRFRAGISEVRTMVNKSLTRASPKVEFQRIV